MLMRDRTAQGRVASPISRSIASLTDFDAFENFRNPGLALQQSLRATMWGHAPFFVAIEIQLDLGEPVLAIDLDLGAVHSAWTLARGVKFSLFAHGATRRCT